MSDAETKKAVDQDRFFCVQVCRRKADGSQEKIGGVEYVEYPTDRVFHLQKKVRDLYSNRIVGVDPGEFDVFLPGENKPSKGSRKLETFQQPASAAVSLVGGCSVLNRALEKR